MNDREKVVNDFESCIKSGGWNHCKSCKHSASYELRLVCKQMAEEILALMKEQETANIYKCPNCGTWVSAENVVRCKDCKYWNNVDFEYRVCKKHSNGINIINFATNGDWYCADGVKKDD